MPYRLRCCCCYFSSHFHSKSIQLNELEMKTEFDKISTQRRHVYYVYTVQAIMMIMFVEQQKNSMQNCYDALQQVSMLEQHFFTRVILKRTLFVEVFWHTTMPCMQYSNVFHSTWYIFYTMYRNRKGRLVLAWDRQCSWKDVFAKPKPIYFNNNFPIYHDSDLWTASTLKKATIHYSKSKRKIDLTESTFHTFPT